MSEKEYPWYDSIWLSAYVNAKEVIGNLYPDRLSEFVDAMDVFRTNPDFEAVELDHLFETITRLY